MGAIATMMLTLAAKVCFRAVFWVKKIERAAQNAQ